MFDAKFEKGIDASGWTVNFGDGTRHRLKHKSTQGLVSRWVSIFENHGVPRPQIPRLMPEFNLSPGDLDNDVELAKRLTPQLQDAACALFNVRNEWLVSGDGAMLETALLDRGLESWIATLERAIQKDSWPELIVCRTEEKEIEDYRYQGAALVLSWKVGEIPGRAIVAYQPVYSVREWRDNGSLFVATRAILAADALNVRLIGITVREDVIDPLTEGLRWPGITFETCNYNSWYPQDYTYGPTSAKAKGLSTLKWVQDKCESDGSAALLREACLRRQENWIALLGKHARLPMAAQHFLSVRTDG